MSDPTPSETTPPVADTQQGFVEAMGLLAGGVVMVTSVVEDQPWALTISACCSVSAEPPLLLISLGTHTASAVSIAATGSFGVSVLGERMLEQAQFGAARGAPKFAHELCLEAPGRADGSPIVRGALTHVDCVVERTFEVADHRLFVGAARSVWVFQRDRPLLYWARRYRALADLPSDAETALQRLFYLNG